MHTALEIQTQIEGRKIEKNTGRSQYSQDDSDFPAAPTSQMPFLLHRFRKPDNTHNYTTEPRQCLEQKHVIDNQFELARQMGRGPPAHKHPL